jgi:hypothetical protein
MEDTLWIEIADAPGEIFDIPELHDFSWFGKKEPYGSKKKNELDFNAKLNSNFDF